MINSPGAAEAFSPSDDKNRHTEIKIIIIDSIKTGNQENSQTPKSVKISQTIFIITGHLIKI